MPDDGPARVALLHDWLTSFGGAERVLAELRELFPTAPIYTLVADRDNLPGELSDAEIRTSFIQNLPGAQSNWQRYMPLFPLAAEQFDLRGFDLILSSSHAAIKGVLKPPGATHVCYCYTPPRYVWDLYHTYLNETRLSTFARRAFKLTAHYFRIWDRHAADRVDHFVAISETVQERIDRIYGRNSALLYPPTDTDFFCPPDDPSSLGDGDFYLVVGRFVPYKKHRLAVQAFRRLEEMNQTGRELVMVGDGPQRERLVREAPRSVKFLKGVSDEELRNLYRSCRALIFPAEEDFGLVPVEAMACGRPVIALGRGGAAETVVDGSTGVHFKHQEPASLAEAIREFERIEQEGGFSRADCRRRAEQFSLSEFRTHLRQMLEPWL